MRAIYRHSIAAIALLASAPVAAQTLSTGTGDGQVTISTSATGQFSGATYNPVGAGTAATTTYDSKLYYRVGTSGARAAISGATAGASTTTSATSIFALAGLTGGLTQTVSNVFTSGVQTGSLLTQTYSFLNTSTSAITLDLVRYFDGDLNFDGSLNDGGGRLTAPNGTPLLFELDSATGASTGTTFVGIYNEGGTANGYQIAAYNGLQGNIASGFALANTIQNAGGDNFIDTGYDVTLGLGALLNIAAGGTGTFTTYTIFGSGSPADVVVPGTPTSAVPEPASWAMMMMGIGMVGGTLRRRRGKVASAALATA